MHQPPSAHTSIGPSAQCNEKPSQLPSYVFNTVPIIITSQQPTLSPLGLTTDMAMISPSATPSGYPTQSPPNKPSWFSNFLPSANPIRKPSYRPSKMPIVLQILNPSGTPSTFPTQQPSAVPTFPLMEFQARKLLTFLVASQVISLVTVHKFL